MTIFEGMRGAAQRLGWKLEPSDPGFTDVYSLVTLTGPQDGVWVRLERAAAVHTFTTSAFLQPPLNTAFAIRHEGLGGAIANVMGFHDVEVGDAAFDESFRVVSKDPAWLIRLLTPEVRGALVRLSDAATEIGGSFHVSEGGVSLTRVYMLPMMTEDVLLDIPLVVGVVRALRDASAGLYR